MFLWYNQVAPPIPAESICLFVGLLGIFRLTGVEKLLPLPLVGGLVLIGVLIGCFTVLPRIPLVPLILSLLLFLRGLFQ